MKVWDASLQTARRSLSAGGRSTVHASPFQLMRVPAAPARRVSPDWGTNQKSRMLAPVPLWLWVHQSATGSTRRPDFPPMRGAPSRVVAVTRSASMLISRQAPSAYRAHRPCALTSQRAASSATACPVIAVQSVAPQAPSSVT